MGLSDREKKRLKQVQNTRFDIDNGRYMGPRRRTNHQGDIIDEHPASSNGYLAIGREIKQLFRRIMRKS